jgi:hypothetical protein
MFGSSGPGLTVTEMIFELAEKQLETTCTAL